MTNDISSTIKHKSSPNYNIAILVNMTNGVAITIKDNPTNDDICILRAGHGTWKRGEGRRGCINFKRIITISPASNCVSIAVVNHAAAIFSTTPLYRNTIAVKDDDTTDKHVAIFIYLTWHGTWLDADCRCRRGATGWSGTWCCCWRFARTDTRSITRHVAWGRSRCATWMRGWR